MKKALSILLILALICVPLAACGGNTDTPAGNDPPPAGNDPAPPAGNDPPPPPPPDAETRDVTLTMWGGEEDQAMLRIIADSFIEEKLPHIASEAGINFNLTIEIGVEGEGTVGSTLLTDPQAGADVFAFPDDQMMQLYLGSVLQEVLINADQIKAANAGGAVDAASVDGTLYAYPLTADNGYFLYYDKSVLSESDVASWDAMADAANAAGMQVTFPMGIGWFNIAFFRAIGLDAWVASDGISTEANINGAGGVDVAQAMLDLAAHPGFISLGGDEATTGAHNGTIAAFVSGPWDANAASDAWGDNYAATKLPTINIAGTETQMGGVLGCKLIGVNAFSEEVGLAMHLAEWVSNYQNQMLRFEMRSQGPSNIEAAGNPAVQANIALAAMAAQAQFSKFFSPGDNYWGNADALGNILADGNPDNTPLQELLDNAVAAMTGN